MPVCWCSPHPNHYNNYLFEHLGRLPGVVLELAFFQKVLQKYPWKSDLALPFETHYFKKYLGIDWQWLCKQIFRKHNKRLYVVAGWNEPTMVLFLTVLAVCNRPYILWSDTQKTQRKSSLRNALRAFWIGFIFNRCCFFFVTGKLGIEAAIKNGVRGEKLVNFPFATNIDYFLPSVEIVRSAECFIASGRLVNSHKGYDTALKAFAICKKRYPELEFRYRIAGTGPDEQEIRQLIRDLDLEREVELVGWLEPAELLNFYHSGSVLLHSSNFDPFPNAVLEAMACGIPVIGSDSAGSAIDRIEPGINGFLHKSRNPDDLAEKIMLFITLENEEKIKMGNAARKTAEKWAINYHEKIFLKKIKDCAES